MPFWTYMLHCADRTFYVGHTDDLQARLWQHETGYFETCYTFVRRPLKLVWCADFTTRDDAFAMERRIKGWSRAKKIALIREDWSLIGDLAQQKKGASTSSARAEEGL